MGLLASRISSPFKQVRSELSYLLVLVFRNLWHNPAVAGAARGGSDDAIAAFFAAVPARVYKMKTTADVDADVSPPKRDDGDAMDEEGTDASGRVHAVDQERSHALAAEIMSGAMRCLQYGGTPLSADCCAPPHAHTHDPALLLLRVM